MGNVGYGVELFSGTFSQAFTLKSRCFDFGSPQQACWADRAAVTLPLVSQQQTLRQSVSYSGVGLHSGNRVTMTLLPAPPNTGVRFRRIDLDGKPEIEARGENVSQTNRSTTLAKGNAKIQTVEHLLAAFAGFEVDNGIIQLDANEPPIGDGS